MALRELLISLKVRSDKAALVQLNTSLDETKARVSSLDTGLLAIGAAASDGSRASAAALRDLAGIAGDAGAEIGANLGSALEPLAARLRQQATAFEPVVAAAQRAGQAVSTAMQGALASLDAQANSTAGAVGASMARVRAVAQTVAAPVARVGAAIQSSIGGSFTRAQAQARVAGARIGSALAPVAAAATRTRAVLAPVLDPLVVAAGRSRVVFERWGTEIASSARRAGIALQGSITSATARSGAAVQSWLARISSAARSAVSRIRGAGSQADSGGGGGGAARGGGGALGNVIAGAAGGAVVAATMKLTQMTRAALSTAGALSDLRSATGASGEALQIWDTIAEQAGASSNDMRTGWKLLSKQVGEANAGNKNAVKIFDELGVATKNADGTQRNIATIMREVGGALGDVASESRRVALGQVLLGDGALALIPAFEGGAAAVDAQVKKYQELGVALSEDAISKGDAAGDALAMLSKEFSKLGSKALGALLPLIQMIGDTLMPLMPQLVASFEPVAKAIADGLTPVIKGLAPIVSTVFGSIAPILGKLAPVFGQLIEQLAGSLMPVIQELLPIFGELLMQWQQSSEQLAGSLMPVIQELLPIFGELLMAVLPIVPAIASGLVPVVAALAPALLQVAQALVPLVQELVPVLIPLIGILSGVLVVLANLLGGRLALVIPVVSGAISVLTRTLDVVVKSFKLLWAAVSGGKAELQAASDALESALGGWWDAVVGFGGRVVGFFTDVWDKILGGINAVANAGKRLLAAVGIGDGATVDVKATAGALGSATNLPARVEAKHETNNRTFENNSTQTFNITAPNPVEAGRQVESRMSALGERDRGQVMSGVLGAY